MKHNRTLGFLVLLFSTCLTGYGQTDSASFEKMVKEANRYDFEKYNQHLDLAKQLHYDNNKYFKAIQIYTYIIEADSIYPGVTVNCIESLYHRAVAKGKLEDCRGAIKDYKRLIEISFLKNVNYRAYLGIGFEHGRLSNYKQAINYLNKAIAINPDSGEPFFYRGLAKIFLEHKDKGCQDLSKAGELGYKEAYQAIQEHCR